MKDDELDRVLDVVRMVERPRKNVEERLELLEDHRVIAELVTRMWSTYDIEPERAQ